MATKKTKNAKNAAEYIDSAGVKINANSDLIIEATKEGEVISARNLLNNTEYVGSGGGGASIAEITNNVVQGPPPTFTPISSVWDITPAEFVELCNANDFIRVKTIIQTKDGDTILSENMIIQYFIPAKGDEPFLTLIPEITSVIDGANTYLIINICEILVEDDAIAKYNNTYEVSATEI